MMMVGEQIPHRLVKSMRNHKSKGRTPARNPSKEERKTHEESKSE
jgi:hypothetical protein